MTNPIVAAFLSKMNYTEKERIQVKLEFLRMVSRMELDPAKMELIYGFFETYLKLNEKEEKQMHEEINKLPREEADDRVDHRVGGADGLVVADHRDARGAGVEAAGVRADHRGAQPAGAPLPQPAEPVDQDVVADVAPPAAHRVGGSIECGEKRDPD